MSLKSVSALLAERRMRLEAGETTTRSAADVFDGLKRRYRKKEMLSSTDSEGIS